MKNSIITAIYFLTGLICIILQDHSIFLPGLIAKALIIPSLIILLFLNSRNLTNRLNLFMFAGLIFSWSGDVILEFSDRYGNLFVPGLICFLIAHVMYFTVFVTTPGKNLILSKRIYLILPVIVYGAVLIYFLNKDLGQMRAPVIIYAVVILTMLTAAINRKEKVQKQSYYLVLSGAICFVLSDSLIAVNKFSVHFAFSGIAIMVTYIAAQYLIVTGFLSQPGIVKTDNSFRI
jgi:uncharacterized membrane protein YhhN